MRKSKTSRTTPQASQPLIEAICTMNLSDDDFFNNPMLCPIGTRNIQGDLPSQERRSRCLKALAEFETSFWGQDIRPSLPELAAQLGARLSRRSSPTQKACGGSSTRRMRSTSLFSLRASAPAIVAIRRTALKYRPRVRKNRLPLAGAGPAPTTTATQPLLFP